MSNGKRAVAGQIEDFKYFEDFTKFRDGSAGLREDMRWCSHGRDEEMSIEVRRTIAVVHAFVIHHIEADVHLMYRECRQGHSGRDTCILVDISEDRSMEIKSRRSGVLERWRPVEVLSAPAAGLQGLFRKVFPSLDAALNPSSIPPGLFPVIAVTSGCGVALAGSVMYRPIPDVVTSRKQGGCPALAYLVTSDNDMRIEWKRWKSVIS